MKIKIKIFVFLLSLSFFLYPIPYTLYPSFAHLIGQPPFFKVNEEYSNLYPVPLTSLYDFDLPQDLAPSNYFVNESINFEFDKGRLPAPPDIVDKTKFDWDFTDGTHSQGLKNTHTFTKSGSYIIKIYADDGTTPKPQLLESALVNILPSKDYQLPKSIIKVNGQETKDPLTDIKQADFKNSISLDASNSTSSNSITEYFWDFGDQKFARGKTQTHLYPKDLSQVFVVLRIKDDNGILSDSFIEITNSQNANQQNLATASAKPASSTKKSSLPITIVIIIISIIVLAMARWFVRGRYRGKHQ